MDRIIVYLEKSPGLALLAGFFIGYVLMLFSFILFIIAAIVILIALLFPYVEIPGIGKVSDKRKRDELWEKLNTRHRSRVNRLFRIMPFAVGLIIGAVVAMIL